VIGVLLLLPLLIGQGGGFLYGLVWGVQQGVQGGQVDVAQATRALETPLLIINAVGTAVPLLLVVIIALTNAKPGVPKKRLKDDFEEDEEEDFPPRRRRDEDFDDR
jgi:hypothetical protein